MLNTFLAGLVSSSTRRGQARKGSALEALLTPYSSQKQFKTGKDALVKELFELYNQTVFDNQVGFPLLSSLRELLSEKHYT